MTRYLLDTNVISEAIRNPGTQIDRRMRLVADQDVGTSIIVSAELRFGMKKNPSFRQREQLEMFLSVINVWPISEPVDEYYADIRHSLRLGRNIGPNDLWIAAHALSMNAVLVTANEDEFSRVPGLKIENWLK
jgi:tRNA(fMet)-specific endonuclease VapC